MPLGQSEFVNSFLRKIASSVCDYYCVWWLGIISTRMIGVVLRQLVECGDFGSSVPSLSYLTRAFVAQAGLISPLT